jgi:tRNA(Arg) A34 adenosine deaminase TadA
MREERFLSMASRCAQESTMHHRHGCVVMMHGKPVSFGHNHIRTYSKDGMICNCCTCHAEVHALRNACKLKVVHRETSC